MCNYNSSEKFSSPHKSQFTYDYDGDDPDLFTPPRKKRRTETIQKGQYDSIIDLDNGTL